MRRAGFWRRVWALFFDSAIVFLPLQILVIVLYAQTNGAIQGTFGFTTSVCQDVSVLPEGLILDPPLPAGFDTFRQCNVGVLGFNMARTLTAVKTVKDGSMTKTFAVSYPLSPEGQGRSAISTDIPATLLLLAYLVFMEHRTGSTYGKRAVKIQCIDRDNVSQAGLPLRKAVIRNLAMWIGFIPALVVWGLIYVESTRPDPSASGLILPLVIAAIISTAWFIWITISVSQKRDPIYDRLAGTAVIRTGPEDPSAQIPPASSSPDG